MNRRFLCLYFPNWPVQAMNKSFSDKAPLILTSQVAGQSIVRCCCKGALHEGVRPEMTVALARALCPSAACYPFEPEQYFKMLYKIALWAFRFSPLVAIDRELVLAYKKELLSEVDLRFYGLILDITGTTRVHRGEVALLQRILFKAEKANLSLNAAIASSVGCAWALSRYGTLASSEVTRVTQRGQLGLISSDTGKDIYQASANLPVAALRVAKETIAALEELGVYTIEDLRALPRKELPSRFGAKLLSQLDQLSGVAQEPLQLIHPHKYTGVHQEFDPPLLLQRGVQKVTLSLIAQILQKLAHKKKRASQFTLIIQGINPQKPVAEASFLIKKDFSLHVATRDLAHISSIIVPFFDSLRIPEGVSQISLTAHCTEHVEYEQKSYEERPSTHVSQQKQDEFLNNTVIHLGRDRVAQIALHNSHVPESAYSFVPIDLAQHTDEKYPHSNLRYPSCILKFPQRVSALSLLPDAPPTRITWRGKALKVLQGFGPERIGNEWWQEQLGEEITEREYFRVQDHTGRWLWIFRKRETMEWYVHGVWS